MQVKSLGSVKIISLNKEAIIKKLKEKAKKLKERDDVLEVYLFGSLVKGKAIPGSDADILILLRRSDKKFLDRIPEFLEFFRGVGIGVEVFPYTLEEFELMKKENLFLSEISSYMIKL